MDSLRDRIRDCASTSPDRIAIIEPGLCELSYAQLWQSLATLAQTLRESGIGPGHTVAVILPDGACGVVSLLGAASVCACAPLNPALTEAELETDLRELNAVAVIATAESQAVKAAAATLKLPVIEVSLRENACTWRVSGSLPAAGKRSAEPDNGGAALLLYTSATTGRRKLVPLSAGNLHAMLENTARVLQLTPDDRLLMLARLFHTQGILSPFAQLLSGGSVIVTQGFSPHLFVEWLQHLQPTWYTCGPTLHRAILTHLEEHPLTQATCLRFVRSGGSALTPALRMALEEALRVPVLNVYGLSETGAVACTTPETCGSGEYSGSVGTSMGPEIAVASADGTLLAAGHEGEVVIAGPTVMSGYLNDPSANREAFFGRWFRTGDLGRLDADGYLYITGRLKEMINRGGQKIIPDEVDAVLSVHEAVMEVATFGLPHPTLGEDVACAVVLRNGFVTSQRELRKFAEQRLAAFKVPRNVFFVDSIPRGATGKPQRRALRERFSDGPIPQRPGFAPPDRRLHPPTLRDYLLQKRVLAGARPVDVDKGVLYLWRKHSKSDLTQWGEDFFTVGGDSLSAVAMLAEAEALFGLELALDSATFFRDPTLATTINMVSEGIAGRVATSSNSIEVVVVRKGNGPLPLFLVPSDGEEGHGFRRLSSILGEQWPLALLRPQNCWHDRSWSTLEDVGAQAVRAIRAERPTGPYLVGGYCYGGAVAYETARQLEQEGQSVFLVFFDTPMPGHPHIVHHWRTYLRAGGGAVRTSWQTSKIVPVITFIGCLARRLLWFAIRRMRPKKTGMWRLAPLRWLCSQSRARYFSFYTPGRINAPILHFLATDEQDVLPAESRLGWQALASAVTTVHWVSCGHDKLLDQSNLHQIAEVLSSWTHSLQGAPDTTCGTAGMRA